MHSTRVLAGDCRLNPDHMLRRPPGWKYHDKYNLWYLYRFLLFDCILFFWKMFTFTRWFCCGSNMRKLVREGERQTVRQMDKQRLQIQLCRYFYLPNIATLSPLMSSLRDTYPSLWNLHYWQRHRWEKCRSGTELNTKPKAVNSESPKNSNTSQNTHTHTHTYYLSLIHISTCDP